MPIPEAARLLEELYLQVDGLRCFGLGGDELLVTHPGNDISEGTRLRVR